jgi:hypothetical protein
MPADSHVYEPSDLWWKALGQKFGDRTPRALDVYQGLEGKFFYTGYQGCPVSRLREHNTHETEAAAVAAAAKGLEACGYDPAIRVRFQEEADIAAEVMNLANDFIFGGILDRFPQLRVVCSEFEMSWVPGFMARGEPPSR